MRLYPTPHNPRVIPYLTQTPAAARIAPNFHPTTLASSLTPLRLPPPHVLLHKSSTNTELPHPRPATTPMGAPTATCTTHVLVFPYPAQGHMIPLFDLAHDLSSRGLAVTVLVTPKNLPLLTPLLSRSPSIRTLVLPFPSHHHHPSIPPGVENVKDLPTSYFFDMIHAIGSLRDPLLRWFRSTPNPPHAIVSDFFLGWTQRLAADLGIPRVNFSPSGANTLSVIHTLWKEMPRRPDPGDEAFLVSFPDVPNSPTYPWWQVSSLYRRYREGEPASEFVKDGFLANLESWAFVVNSLEALDGSCLGYLRGELGHPRVFAVGPLLGGERGTGGGGGELFGWLDTCPEGSVVYVCFGSQVVLRKGQAEAIAGALEGSGVRFVWAVKGAVVGEGEEDGEVPGGFEERVRGRGMVVRGWAPQVAVLRHAAVGAFLSHCGWNSVLEAVGEGVVVLAWPMGADQYLNARLLVEEKGVGVRVCEGSEAVPEVGQLARVLREAAVEEGGLREEKERAREMCRKAREAVEEGGESSVQLEALVADLRMLGRRRSPHGGMQ